MTANSTPERSSKIVDHPLYRSIQSQIGTGLPIAAHINGDTSWLILIPYPADQLKIANHLRYFKILIDPWFTGFNEQGALFSRLLYAEQHSIPSSVETIAELEDVLRHVQEHEGELRELPTERVDGTGIRSSPIDLVVVSNDNGDHCNESTLRQLPASVPVVALPLPMKILRGYRHFHTLHAMRAFSSCIPEGAEVKQAYFGFGAGKPSALDWRLATYPGLPRWLSLAWTETPGEHPPFHTPMMIAFPVANSTQDAPPCGDKGHAIIYTPHSAPMSALAPFRLATPELSFLAMMAGFHRVWVKGLLRISEGARGGIEMAKELQPEYWLATHDEVKETTAKGLLIPPLLRRDENGFKEVVEYAQQKGFQGRVVGAGEKKAPGDIKILQLKSGEACVLGELEIEERGLKVKP